MKTNHTPGPWEMVQIGADAGQINIRHATETGTSYIARIWDIQLCEEHGDFKANARLIASAPELLELANQIILASESAEGAIPVDIVDGARAAIAKATGN